MTENIPFSHKKTFDEYTTKLDIFKMMYRNCIEIVKNMFVNFILMQGILCDSKQGRMTREPKQALMMVSNI